MKFPEAHPVVLGTVTTAAGLRCLARKNVPADAVEVRVDALLAEKVPVEIIVAALRAKKHPVLLTLRIPPEGGLLAWKVKERRELFLRLLPLVEAIDVELATAGAMAAVIEEARRTGKTVVLSAHAIAKPATIAQFARWTGSFSPLPETILKIAARIQSWRDLQQLAALLVNHPEWPLAVMGLGPYAAQSRSVLTALGSRLVYGYLDAPAAPGQPSAAEVRKMVAAVRKLEGKLAKHLSAICRLRIKHPYVLLAAGIAFGMAAITFPMLFSANAIDISSEYDTISGSIIRCVWIWGAEATANTSLPEPIAELLMCAINFCVFFFTLVLPYFVYQIVIR